MTPAEAGLQVMARLGNAPVPSDLDVSFQWPRCLVCRRRPTLTVRPGRWLIFLTGLDEPQIINVPRYDILPCCSARYVKEAGLGKKAQRQILEQVKARKDGPATVA